MPAARAFKPELVLISAGFDPKKNDALGSWNVTSLGVSKLTRIAIDIAEEFCDGRLVSMLEGGYADRESSWENGTFHGLSDRAEAQVRTLLTGEVQPEGSYFGGTRSEESGSSHPRRRRAPSIENGRIVLPSDLESAEISIRRMDGRRIAEDMVLPEIRRADGVPLPRLPAGSYVVTVRSSGRRLGVPVVVPGRE